MAEKGRGKRKIQMSETVSVMMFLTISGGFQDAYSYFVRGQVFANAQTGNVVLMAMNFFAGNFLTCLRYLFPLCAFGLGIFAAERTRARSALTGRLHWRHTVLGGEIVLLFIVGLIPVNETMNPLANALTSFACAMQVQTFKKVNGHAYASTMCIGNIRSGMEAFSVYLRLKEPALLRRAGQYFLVIFLFFIGAGIGSVVAGVAGENAGSTIFATCIFLSVSFVLMMFEKKKEE